MMSARAHFAQRSIQSVGRRGALADLRERRIGEFVRQVITTHGQLIEHLAKGRYKTFLAGGNQYCDGANQENAPRPSDCPTPALIDQQARAQRLGELDRCTFAGPERAERPTRQPDVIGLWRKVAERECSLDCGDGRLVGSRRAFGTHGMRHEHVAVQLGKHFERVYEPQGDQRPSVRDDEITQAP